MKGVVETIRMGTIEKRTGTTLPRKAAGWQQKVRRETEKVKWANLFRPDFSELNLG